MRPLVAMLLGLALLVAPTPSAAASSNVSVTIKITTTAGTVWGKVRLSYRANGMMVKKSCGKAKCKYSVPMGVTLRLKETPTNSQTWPFKGWVIRSAMAQEHSKSTSVTWHATAATVIKAVYTLPASNSSSGSGWGG